MQGNLSNSNKAVFNGVEEASGEYIYWAAKQLGKYPPLASDTKMNSCFSILKQWDNIAYKDDFWLVYSSQRLQFSRALLGGE